MIPGSGKVMRSKLASGRILVASHSVADAHLVKQILDKDYHDVVAATATAADDAVDTWKRERPAVLVLAFNALDDAQRYYLAVCRHSQLASQQLHRTVLLCGQSDVLAYALCRDQLFDDYVVFWPASLDVLRLPMAVHVALREARGAQRPLPAQLEQLTASPSFSQLDRRPVPDDHVQPRSPADRGGATVLVVDDDSIQRELVANVLAATNYRLMFAAGGADALLMLADSPVDLILMDVMMPGMDGAVTTRRLRAVPRLVDIPVIMMTGTSKSDIVFQSISAGATDFVVKPIDRATLLEKVATALGTRARLSRA